MTKKNNSVVLTGLDLNMFSDQLLSLLNDYMPEAHKLKGNEIISVGPGRGLLEVKTFIIDEPEDELSVEDDFTVTYVHLTDEDVKKHICGYIAFAKILRNALSTFSWQFIEWVLVTYGAAFNEGELSLAEELTEDYILDNIGKDGITGVRREFLTRWVEKGIVCKGDIAIRDELRPVASDDKLRTKLPINYPMLIVGQAIFFNQTVTTPYMTISRVRPDDEMAPLSVGAIVYESLGVAVVEQKGPEATYTYYGKRYHADPLGVRLLAHAEKVNH